tara:strand:+ start:2888 stop:4783 length:1896 start_codon:yes stop_codon:yes gene_type:complete
MPAPLAAAIPVLLGKVGAVVAKGAAVAAKGAAVAAKASAKAAASAAKATGRGLAQAGKGMGRGLGKLGKGLKPKLKPKLKTTKVKSKSFGKKKLKSKVRDKFKKKLKNKVRDKSKKKLNRKEKDTEEDKKLNKKSREDSFTEKERVEKTDQVQGQEAATNLTQPQNVVEKIKPADTRLPPIQQLKINSTNIKNFLVSENKKKSEAKKLNARNAQKEGSESQFGAEERKLEFSPFGGSDIGDQELPKPSGGNIFQKLFEFLGLILLGIFVNALPAIIESVKGIINSVVDFVTPIMSGFNLVKDFFTGEVDRKGSDVDKKRVDDSLRGVEEDGGLIDQIAEKLGPLGGIVKMLKPVVGMFRKQAGGKKIVKAKKGGKEGFLNKETGQFTPKQWTAAEREEYESTKSKRKGDGGGGNRDSSDDSTVTTSTTSQSGKSVTAAGTGGISGFPITSDYGQRWGTLHGGIDIGTPTGTALAIDKPGKVLASGIYGGYGNMIDAWVPALKVQFRFAHLVKRYKKSGESFKANEVIGETGGGLNDPGKGSSTGPHLHYEIDTNYNGTRYGGARNRSLLHEMSKHIKLGTASATTNEKGGQFSKLDAMEAVAKLWDTSSENESHNVIVQPYRTIQTQIVYM